MKAREFLENYDPQIKDNPSSNYTYSIEQVIERLNEYANKKQCMYSEKIDLLVKFFSKARYADDPHLDELDALDELANEVYSENRIKRDFGTANDMANRAVIKRILSK